MIPLLVLHDGRSLYESGTICEYLDETYPEPPLRPADAYGRAEMRNWIRYADERIGNLIIFNWKHSTWPRSRRSGPTRSWPSG